LVTQFDTPKDSKKTFQISLLFIQTGSITRILFVMLFLTLVSLGYGQFNPNQLFYEEPQQLVSAHTRFPQAHRIGSRIYLVYQRILPGSGGDQGTMRIEYQSSTNGILWSQPRQIGPPIAFSGESPPPVFSFVQDGGSRGIIAIAEDANRIRMYRIIDTPQESGFTPLAQITSNQTLVSPAVFPRPDGGYFLFVTLDVEGRPSLQISTSINGTQWSALQGFSGDPALILTFNPTYVFFNNQHHVFYQGVLPAVSNFYQIFVRTSNDGIEWSNPRVITNESDELDLTLQPRDYDNQRPSLAIVNNRLFMTWERRTQTRNIQVYGAFLRSNLDFENFPEPISNRIIGAGNPQVKVFQNLPLITYFDNPQGISRLIMTIRQPQGTYQSRIISTNPGVNTFAALVVDNPNLVHVFWQNRLNQQAQTARIFYRMPDQQVARPQIIPLNYQLGQRSNEQQVRYRIIPPQDPSGIQGFAFSWSQDPNARTDISRTIPINDGLITLPALEDGSWYFQVRVQDGAGNWSDPQQVSFFLDSTPPEPIVFRYPSLDESGFLASNSFTLSWLPSNDEDLGGYAVALRFLGPEDSRIPVSLPPLPPGFGRTLQASTQISRQNLDNGLWALTVSAVDRVGNVSEPNTLFFRLNKYIPVTLVGTVQAQENILGQILLSFTGRGFTANGLIDEIILDRDGQEPWDYHFRRGDDFRIVNDRTIQELLIRDVRTGTYQVLFNHTERGIYRLRQPITLQDTGTVRFGDFTIYQPLSLAVYNPGVLFRYLHNTPVYWTTLFLLALTMVLSFSRLTRVVQDGRQLRLQAHAILYQLPRSQSLARRTLMLKRQGISLGVKITVLIVLLVSSVIALIALPLRTYFLTSQQETLARGLEERVGVLVESIAAGAVNILPTVETSTIELAQLIQQSQVMEEAEFVTITAVTTRDGQDVELVWATNDPLLLGTSQAPSEIDELNRFFFDRSVPGEFVAGVYSLEDRITGDIRQIREQIDNQARDRVGDVPDQLNELLAEAISLVFDQSQEAIIRRREIDSTIRGLNDQLDVILREIAGPVRSIPQFDSSQFNPEQSYYLFFKPVVFRGAVAAGQDARYYQGMVRMGVSTETINAQIFETAQIIQNNIIIFSVIALIAGIAGAALLSLITILPIRALVKGVERIRDTEDKAKLKDFRIKVRSKDELFTLSNVIEQMTSGLAKGAEKDKELLFGKDIQKMFISLDVGDNNLKKTTGHTVSEYSEFFGYYEGAKGVSGDYFYYQKITQDTFAIIKCDISGKGISAALIMVEVATLFLNYFNDWEKKRIQRLRVAKALKQTTSEENLLTELVYNINDLIAERQFVGKFAALNIVLFNETTGELNFCNAGDNQVFTFRKQQSKLIQSTLFASPASGMFNSKDMPIQFKEEKDKLYPGDVLLFFTDGMEESKRYFMNDDGTPHRLTQEEIDKGLVPAGSLPETDSEEMGLSRLHDLINAIENRQVFKLQKYFAPYEKEPLVFDFTGIENTPEHTVLGVVAVEKMFRLIPNPKAVSTDRVTIDKKIDDFLKETFNQYNTYFHSPLPEDPNSLYRTYEYLQEDEQYDDLTILAVKKF
jgi:hypothetical protein